ncbi:MAG: rhomboid family intramembrane serine protease [Muribaculaceae bacterium]|nr:rhomboid family intramembrane serine protease [Muribaculaceae bacterium]
MNNFSFRRPQLPPVTKNLIIINVLLWLVEFILPDFANHTLLPRLGLHPFGASDFNPVQPFTYMFLHDPRNPVHIFFNMFSLWMFGRILEQVWGSQRYLIFYLVCGVGAALVQEAVWAMTWRQEFISAIAPINGLTYNHAEQIVNAAIANHDTEILAAIAAMKNQMVTVGASGAIFGLLLGFAFVFPNMPMYLFFIPVPIKAKYMVLGYAVLEFFFGISGGGTIAHFAHLGGMLFGLIMILYWKKKGTLYQ